MASATNVWTVERLHALPDDGRRYEIVDGDLLVTPAPIWRHQRAIRELSRAMNEYLSATTVAEVLHAPADVDFDRFNLVQPDVFVVPLVGGRQPRNFKEASRLLLAIEVLSPSTTRADREIKRRLYQTHGIEYWIVNGDGRVVERWRIGAEQPEILSDQLVWQPAGADKPFILFLPAFFASLGEP